MTALTGTGAALGPQVADAALVCLSDVDGNGSVDVATDVVYIARYLAGLTPVPPSFRAQDPSIPSDAVIAARIEAARAALDVDGSGAVEVPTDIVYLARHVLGLTPVPPSFRAKDPSIPPDTQIAAAIERLCAPTGPSISGISPASGPIGTLVTITGAGFEPGATTVAFTGSAATIRTITANQITMAVPVGAKTGLVTVTTPQGSPSAQFTVTLTGDFSLSAAPKPPDKLRVIAGDHGSAQIQATGTGSFTGLVSLSVSTGPPGITGALSQPVVAPGGTAGVTFNVANTVAPGTYAFTITGEAQVDGQLQTANAPVTLEVLAPETRAVTGQVLTAEALPLGIPGVRIALGGAVAFTDAAGNFTLLAPPTGANMLLVDGATGSTSTAQYPIVEIQVNVAATGATRVDFPIYLPKIDTAHPINLPLDPNGFTTQQVLATTPLIPDLVVTIPQGTKITDINGNPVAQVTITPVPVNRSPMPFPAGVSFPVLFAIQPGGAVPSKPLPITFPNATREPPGKTASLYYFDLDAGGWKVWGQGTVSDNARSIVSNPGAGLPRLAWHGTFIAPDGLEPLRKMATGGDPVDLATGRFTVDKTDLVLPGRLPVVIRRTYRSDNNRPDRAGLFGIGWNLETYDARLVASGGAMLLLLPDQNRFLLSPSGKGQWQSTSEPFLLGAVLTQQPGDFNFALRFKDGMVYRFDRIVGFGNVAGLAAIVDRNTNALTITRDPNPPFGRITEITGPGGRTVTLTYTGGRITSIADPLRVVHYAYDTQGRLESVIHPPISDDSIPVETRYAYDPSHRIATITNARSIVVLRNTYDADGRVIQQDRAPGGGSYFFHYNRGIVPGVFVFETSVTDPDNNVTTWGFGSGTLFPTYKTVRGAETTTVDYFPGSNLVRSLTGPLNRTVRFTYDEAGNVLTVTDGLERVRSFTYEPSTNRLMTIRVPDPDPIANPSGIVTRFEYDAAGNLTKIIPPLPLSATVLGDYTLGQPGTITDPLGKTTTLTYDDLGHLATTTDPLGNTTRFGYDAVGRLTDHIDPRGRRTKLTYDALNHVTSILDALDGVTRFTYDRAGNLLDVIDAATNRVKNTYDSMGRLATRTDALDVGESFTYYPSGKLNTRVDRKGQQTLFKYYPSHRLSDLIYSDGTTHFTYDAAGRVDTIIDSIGGTLRDTYDELDRLTSRSTRLGTVAYQYDTLGRRKEMSLPGGTPTLYEYNAASQLIGVRQGSQVAAFEHDSAGRRTSLTLPNGVTTEYHYDDASRLTTLVYRNRSGVLGSLTYEYDRAGNRTRVGGSLARTGIPVAVLSSIYDPANRQRAFGSKQLSYDKNGNLIDAIDEAKTTSYAWDARDRLIAVEEPGALTTFRYAFGKRLTKTLKGVSTEYLYDGPNIVQEIGSTATTHYLRSLGVDETLAYTQGGSNLFPLVDALGSTLATTDESGSVATEYTYEPFGATTRTGSANLSHTEYNGREHDETGLYYLRARYYSPTLHRFLSEDPIRHGSNLYTYAANNPTNFVDPFGLDEEEPCLLAGAGDYAASWYADKYVRSGNPLYAFGGLLASLWTPDTCRTTANVLLTGLAVGGAIRAARAAEAAASRGLGKSLGVFEKTVNQAGGEIWTSTGEISQNEFATYVNSGLMKGEVNILTGVHGSAGGAMEAEAAFLEADVARFGNIPGVNIHNVPGMSAAEITSVLRGPGTTIGGFCNSGACLAPFR